MSDEQKPLSNDEKMRQEANQKISDGEFETQMEIARKIMRKKR